MCTSQRRVGVEGPRVSQVEGLGVKIVSISRWTRLDQISRV